MIHGEQKDEEDRVDGRYSPPAVSGVRTVDVGLESVPVLGAKEKPPINVVGDVSGRIAIMVVSMLFLVLNIDFLSIEFNYRHHKIKNIIFLG